eukprot:4487913-Prymnesium_polylepis.1
MDTRHSMTCDARDVRRLCCVPCERVTEVRALWGPHCMKRRIQNVHTSVHSSASNRSVPAVTAADLHARLTHTG